MGNTKKTYTGLSIKEIGTKGVFLQDMFKAKVLVPASFIITNTFDEFIKDTKISSQIDAIIKKHNASLGDADLIMKISNEISDLIDRSIILESFQYKIYNEFYKLKTEFVAMRTSLLVDDPLSAYLHNEFTVQLNVDKENIINSTKKMWSSFFSPAVITYHLRKKINIKKPVAVILVQKMIDAQVSGVCYTSHPMTKDRNQILIEANYGLSEGKDRYSSSKDTYVVDKNKFKILGKSVLQQKNMLTRVGASTKEVVVGNLLQSKQKLSDKQIIELSKLATHIDKYYKKIAQKIEWVIENDKIYIIESQPVN